MAVAYRLFVPAALAAVLALASACDNGPSAVAVKDRPSSSEADAAAPERNRSSERAEASREPAPLIDGKPMWSSTERYTAEENAQRAFDRNGADFGAKDVEDFVRKAHAFADDPPKGAETLSRANGDRLLYDPKGNVFMVVTRQGAPRTMFKPEEGAAYWDEQKTREQQRQSARRSVARSDDNG